MRFYVSKCHDKLNGTEYSPEKYAEYLCINPYYPVSVKNGSKFIIDSGAFQDVGKNCIRLSFEEALNRQLRFESKVTVDGRPAEAIVSYDRLVDEQYDENEGQFKARVSLDESIKYVEETIEAAKYLASKRDSLSPRKLILSCQGTTTEQYLNCLEEILKFATPEDIIGLGGFCIISKNKEYEEQFYEVISRGFPLIHAKGITRVHIFGVGMFRALIQAEICAKLTGIECSYDTSSCEVNSVFGKVFDPCNAMLSAVFNKNHKKNGYNPPELAEFNINSILHFWADFEKFPLPEAFEPSLLTPRKKSKK